MMLKELLLQKSSRLSIQFFRYFIVGGIATVFDIGFLYFFTEFLLIYYLVSAALAFLVGVIVNYTLSKLWVFDKSRYSFGPEFIIFFIIGIVGLGLNELILYVSVEFFSLWYMTAKIISVIIVFCWNFFARKKILF